MLLQADLRPPRTMTIAITAACNLACSHCWVNAGREGSHGHLPERTIRRLLEEFVALGGNGVCLTGGEPLCHPSWLKLLQFSRSLGLDALTIQTNGMQFTAASVAALHNLEFAHLKLQVSLDGATAATHDLVRGPGAFAGALAGIRLLVKGGLGASTSLFFTEMRHNLAEIPDLLRLVRDLRIGSMASGCLVRCGRAAAESVVAPPDPEQYRHLLERYGSDLEFRTLYEKFGTVAALEWPQEETSRSEGCSFVEHPYLTADGKLYPCVMCHADSHAVTGVHGKSLASAFAEGAPLWAALMETSRCRAESITFCHDCPGRHVCAGGCMGRAWGGSGDFMAVDDRCQTRRTIYRETVR